MPKLIIDDQEIEVASGTKVIQAAEQLGIMIPRFCYHPALGSVGACRVCAVKLLEGRLKGVQMSCMIDAQDGMVVSTTDEEAVDFRTHVIEWLMLNHPHDCPVCDEGGHCLLQDMTVSGGHGIRRYLGKKRTYQDQYLGPLIRHEMNRCIHCYRCSRFYQEFCGYRDLGALQSANRTYFGRFQDGILDSPFTGNLSDICPTGVYTDKPSRFRGRRWDYQRSPSLCIHCCLGCHTIATGRYREIVRQEARFSEAVNGHFICDRGRYGFFYANHEARPRRARVAGDEVSYDQALQALKAKLAEISKRSGPGAIACVSSDRSSLETQAVLKRIGRMRGWRNFSGFMPQGLAQKVQLAVARLEPALSVSLRELEGADFIVVVGADPINEAPMLALALRQARRKGAAIAVIDPRPIALPFDFQHVAMVPGAISLGLGLLARGSPDEAAIEKLGPPVSDFYAALPTPEVMNASDQKRLSPLIRDLRSSRRPVIVCGTAVGPATVVGLAADWALLLQAVGKKAGLFYLLPGANAFSAGILSDPEDTFEKTVEGIENGSIKALMLVENNPFWQFPDRARLEQALARLDLLVVLDYLNSAAAQQAHIFLPTATLYEIGGLFVNQEGRVQAAQRAHSGGIPIAQSGGGGHPPRIYGAGVPGAEPRPAWRTLAELVEEVVPPDEARMQSEVGVWLAEEDPRFADLPPFAELPEDGARLNHKRDGASRFLVNWTAELQKSRGFDDSFELLAVDWTFGTEELAVYSACLKALERKPGLLMHPDDAGRLGLTDGDEVAMQLDRGTLKVPVGVVANMAPGVIVLPRHRLLEWQRLACGRIRLERDRIRKAASPQGPKP
ncbi:MAG: NADH-quinone oxidoreductase subunit NuoG [Desulfobacterales bacterium]|nr:MAG: NADH-quinone oxidoreductase subunit NuoG [Desulfobacterales bacterium]